MKVTLNMHPTVGVSILFYFYFFYHALTTNWFYRHLFIDIFRLRSRIQWIQLLGVFYLNNDLFTSRHGKWLAQLTEHMTLSRIMRFMWTHLIPPTPNTVEEFTVKPLCSSMTERRTPHHAANIGCDCLLCEWRAALDGALRHRRVCQATAM